MYYIFHAKDLPATPDGANVLLAECEYFEVRRLRVNGETTVKKVKMVQSFKEKVKFDCIQSIQIEKKGDTYTFYEYKGAFGEPFYLAKE